MLEKSQNNNSTLEELTSTGEGAGLESEKQDSLEDSELQPFDPALIDVVTQIRTIDSLLSRLKFGELDLSPDFQRRGNLWNNERKTSLIESLLLRIPIPSLYVSEDEDGDYAVVDGLQRLCAISHFVQVSDLNKAVNSKLDPLRLCDSGLKSLKEHSNKSFEELPRQFQRRIIETELTLHIIRANTPSAVKFNIFSRINQGGLPLKAQEIRNAIYHQGIWRPMIRILAESKEFLDATEHKIKGERMEDMELILRVIALYDRNKPRLSKENLDDFLNDFVEEKCIHWEESKWQQVFKDLKKSMNAATQIFGEYAFRKYYNSTETRKPINRGLFEAKIATLALYDDKKINQLIRNKHLILKKYEDLFNLTDYELDDILNDNEEYARKKLIIEFNRSISSATGKGWASNKRLEIFDKIFDEAS